MANENDNLNEKINLEIAKDLAIEGKYEEAINILSPLVHSPFSIEALNLLAKIYAQNKDFKNAEYCFMKVLEQDENNSEALNGYMKCKELKGSKIKTFFNFNKTKSYVILFIILLIIILAIALLFKVI